MKSKSIAIILLNWNNSDFTIECIKSLKKTTYLNKKIIVVDNASSDDSLTKISSNFPEIDVIVNSKNLGFTGGNNVGIKRALQENFDFIMLLNNDTIVEESFIEPLVDAFGGNVGAVQPLILNYPEKGTIWNNGGSIDNFLGRFISLDKNKSIKSIEKIKNKRSEWISGCCFMLRSSLISKIGLLDEKFFVYFEDVDWSIKISDLKLDLIIVQQSRIFHHEGASWNSKKRSSEGYVSPYTHYLNIRNHILILRKHSKIFNPFGSVFFQTFKIFAYTTYFLLRFRFNKLSMVYKGLRDSLKIQI